MSDSKSIFLDVDSSIVENNLLITDDDPKEDFNKIFGSPGPDYPSKLVKPHPGLCIKTKQLGTEVKVFVNICTTDAIPSPKNITEAELLEIIDSDASDYRIPMSIGEIRPEKDAKGSEAKAVDIAIHPTFFKKIESNQTFKNFFMAVVFQGLEHKYELVCADEKIILTNKKAYGTLQVHRIQQREIDEKMGKLENKSLISELTGDKETSKKPVIELISSVENKLKEPDYRLFKKQAGPNHLWAEIKLPEVLSPAEITLDVGEDRLILESKSCFLDIFVPYCIRNEKCSSTFDKASKILTVKMPVMGG